ncbi:acyl-CoA dehydrogenase [Cohnella phaseoli]|uniref:Alkylation response protein AidB-like acyl-CoA dehydrogenase n=1 Tax=Cohnella phaseoli TaxID=456490 RepID=A0A3D9I1U0_9BACL|nr:acyl-CoA dehydrogenase [Cohnella phaseoli]RED55610.1 alkylation response protein AidB-like acyl-CoA dehydrogenase [Cohnella phaseoli]
MTRSATGTTTGTIPISLVHAAKQYASLPEGTSLPSEVLAGIYEAKLFKLFVPKDLNGLMLPLPDALRVFAEASEIDGTFGWLVTIGSGGGFFSATLPPEEAQKQFAPANAVVAGSGLPSGVAHPVEGGYRVSGQWKYCSGSTFASLYTANCRIDRGAEAEPEIRSFAFLPDQVRIIRDWNSFGLKGTDSHSMAVDDVFVPEERTFSIMSLPNYDDPIFRYPFLPFAQTSFAAVCLGICRHFLAEADLFVAAKRAEWEPAKPGRAEETKRAISRQEAKLEAEAAKFYETVERTWNAFLAAGEMTEEDQAEVGTVCRQLSGSVLAYAHAIFPLLGMAVLMEEHPINRIWRDLHTVTQHAVLVPKPELV